LLNKPDAGRDACAGRAILAMDLDPNVANVEVRPAHDGSVRMYYSGGVLTGSPGTPAYYDNNQSSRGVMLMQSGMIMSALSKDDGGLRR
jgi:hypothetical protein